MKSTWLEVKSTLFSLKVLAFILVLLAFQVVLVSQFESINTATEQSQLQQHQVYRRTSLGMQDFWQKQYDYLQEHGRANPGYPFGARTITADLAWYQYEALLADKLITSLTQQDWAQYNLHMAEKRLLEWEAMASLYEAEHPYSYFPPPQEVLGAEWERYTAEMELLEVRQLPHYFGERSRTMLSPERTLLSTIVHLNLMEQNLPPQHGNSSSAWSFLFNFWRQGLPAVLALVVLLISANTIQQDKKYGVIKTKLQYPKSRTFYLLRKIKVGFISSVCVVTMPQLLMFVILGIKNGFRGLHIPVLISSNFWEWQTSSEHIRLLRWTPDYQFSQVGLSQFPPSYTGTQAMESVEFIPLWQFLLLNIVMLGIFVLFCTVLGLLISTIIKNDIFAQVMAVAVFALGNIFGHIFPDYNTSSWDIFSKANVIPLLEGNHFSSYLNSSIVLIAASLLLFLLTTMVFHRQDIISD